MGQERRAQEREFDFNREEAEKARSFSHEEAEIARDWQTEEREKSQLYQSEQWQRQFDAQNAYNTPEQQVKRLQEGGINPGVYFGRQAVAQGGSTTVTPPSAPGTSPASGPAAHGSVGYGSQIPSFIASIGDAVKSLSSAGLGAMQSKEISTLLSEKLKGYVLDNEQKGLLNVHQTTENWIQQNIKSAEVLKAFQILGNVAADTYMKKAAGDKSVSEVDLNRALKALHEATADVKGQESAMLKIRLAYYEKELRAGLRNLDSQTAKNVAETQTENELREYRKNLSQEQVNELKAKIKATDWSNMESAVRTMRMYTGLSDNVWNDLWNMLKKSTGIIKQEDVLKWFEQHGIK